MDAQFCCEKKFERNWWKWIDVLGLNFKFHYRLQTAFHRLFIVHVWLTWLNWIVTCTSKNHTWFRRIYEYRIYRPVMIFLILLLFFIQHSTDEFLFHIQCSTKHSIFLLKFQRNKTSNIFVTSSLTFIFPLPPFYVSVNLYGVSVVRSLELEEKVQHKRKTNLFQINLSDQDQTLKIRITVFECGANVDRHDVGKSKRQMICVFVCCLAHIPTLLVPCQ